MAPAPSRRMSLRTALMAGCVALGCSEPEAAARGTIHAVDDAGRVVMLERPALRIVSLAPSSTETLVRLGVSDRLVARTAFDHDEAIEGLPVIGRGSLATSAESVVELAPDLVVVWGDPVTRPLAGRLGGLGLTVFVSEPHTIADVLDSTTRLGRLVGAEARADSLVGAIRARMGDVRKRVAGRPAPRVLFLVWAEPPFTTGPGTYADEVIRSAGGRNVFFDMRESWGEVSLESIIDRDPDWVVAGVPAETLERTRLGALDAVREGRVLTVDPDLFHRPGPRVADAIEILARRLHPEAFL